MFNLLREFILILKKIFRSRSEPKFKKDFPEREAIEIPQPPEEENPEEVIPREEKIVEVPPSGKETEITPAPEGITPGPSLTKDEVGVKPPEEKKPELPPKPSEEVLKTESFRESKEEVKTKSRKPYKKKVPTEERGKEHKMPPEDEKKPDVPIQRRKIDLGDIKKKKPRLDKKPQQSLVVNVEKPDKAPEEKETPLRIESPSLEIELDEVKVFLIIPKQQLKTHIVNNIPQQLYYKLVLDGGEQTISARTSNNEQGIATVEEKRIDLEQHLKKFKIIYPNEFQNREYNYQHTNEVIYAFIAIGNSRGRMHYLYDSHGNLNPLPKKVIWILLEEGFDLFPEPNAIEERWIWIKYQPKRVNLKNINELVVKNRQTEEEIKIPCESSFSIEGDGLVEDDFKEQMPLFAGNSIKIKAPRENPDGWLVWIQNKQAGYKIIARNWTGNEPLELKLPDDLPCECGEFQVDICEQEDRIPIETLFFRYIPYLQLRYPSGLIIPEANTGHKQEIIQIFLGKEFQDWSLKLLNGNEKVQHGENGYQVVLLPEQDILRFSLIKRGKPETEASLRITIPRLKWRTSNKKTWNYKIEKMRREELIPGQELDLLINTNDLNNKYKFLARLEASERKLQEVNFSRKGSQYIMRLNQLYDTIKQNKGKLTLKVEIRNPNDNRFLGMPEILQFMEIIQESLRPKSVSYDLINFLSLPRICSILSRIKTIYPKERLVCKDILQIYYQKIRSGKKANRDITLDKKDFVIKALAFIKFILKSYDKKVQIKGQKKWRRRIDFLQQKYPEEFDNAYDKFSRR